MSSCSSLCTFTSSSAWARVRSGESRSNSTLLLQDARGVCSSWEALPMKRFCSRYWTSNLSAALCIVEASLLNSGTLVSEGTGGIFFPGL